MRTLLIITACLLTTTPNAAQDPSSYSNDSNVYRIKRCTVSVKEERRIPAQDAGVLMELNVKEGDSVEEGVSICKIDDTETIVRKLIAESARERAKAEAENEINVDYSTAAAGVAKMELEKAHEANASGRRKYSVYPLSEIRRLELDYKRAGFQIDQARMDMNLAKLDENVRIAELDGVEKALARLQINAPFDGMIVRIYRKKGEWVQPGDPILWLMKFDTMTVQGSVDASLYDPIDVAGKPVSVEVQRARGRKATLEGKVTYVSPVILGDNTYEVEAEVANINEGGRWIVPHGAMATMTIRMN